VRAAEEAGFSTVWNLDHFSGAMFGSDTMLECFAVLGAWAQMTSTIKVGSLVANVVNRTPGLLAHAATTVQTISAGRLVLGVGAGSSPTSPYGAEQRALGIEMLPRMSDRHQRLIDTMTEVRRIWTADRDGDLAGFPRPSPVPPVIVGLNSEALARRAGALYDGVNVRFNHDQRGELLSLAREASGRDNFDCSVWAWFKPELCDADHPFRQELAAEGVTRLVLLVKGAPDPSTIASTARHLR
jgi:alkanesulfonate monooxygenase SsuD/methylene tetrahydromethanopterin reductase-like flavin-dependent oxidoreductase (luciferase family)